MELKEQAFDCKANARKQKEDSDESNPVRRSPTTKKAGEAIISGFVRAERSEAEDYKH